MECLDVPTLAPAIRQLLLNHVPKSIKVLHILHAFSAGGLENGLVNIINRSPDHLKHELCFLTRGGDFLNKLERPVPFHELHKTSGIDLRMFGELSRVIRHSGPDVIHTRNWAAFDGVVAACASPNIAVLHGEHGRDIRDPLGLNRRRNLLRRLFGFRIQKFIAVSHDLLGWLSSTVGIAERKLLFIPNGVDTNRFRPQRSQALRNELGIGSQEFVVGSVGRLDPIKNFPGLIRAVQALHEQKQRLRLVIVGDGPQRRELEELVRQTGLGDVVLLVGYRSDVGQFYGLFDCFVLNSFAEGMSNTLLEAMACGVPVICTSVGGNPELVPNGIHGYSVPSGNDAELACRIAHYHSQPNLRSKFGDKARQFVEMNYSLSTMVNHYLDLYQSVARMTS